MTEEIALHRIRLAGPWEVAIEEASLWQSPAPGKILAAGNLRQVQMPVCWHQLFSAAASKACFRRKFNQPSGLATQRLWITCEELTGSGTLFLNQQRLGEFAAKTGPQRYEVTSLLQLTNQLELHFSPARPSPASQPVWRQIVLEIEETET